MASSIGQYPYRILSSIIQDTILCCIIPHSWEAQEEAEAAAEAKKRKDEIDLAKKTWGEKRDDLKNQTNVVEEQIKWANKEFQAAVTQGQKTDNAQMKNKCFKQLGDCQERIKEKTEALSQLQAKMAKLMEKKPKEK